MQVFTGGPILTMRAAGAAPEEALACDDGRIVAVGRKDDVLAAAGPGADVVDLGGRALVPGFIDTHHHYMLAAFHAGCVDVSPPVAPDIARLGATIASAAERAPRDEWIVARGYDEAVLAERRHPTRADLDSFCADRPVLLLHYSCHEGVVNSRALERVGIDRNTPDPPGGQILRERGGQPNGRLLEVALMKAEALARASRLLRDEAAFVARLARHEDEAFAGGITRIVDPMVPPDVERILREARDRGLLRMPLTAMPVGSVGLAAPPRDRLDGGSRTGEGPEDFRIGPMKLVFDGANRCAMCFSILELIDTSLRTLGRAIARWSLDPLRPGLDAGLRLDGFRVRTGIRYYTPDAAEDMIAAALSQGFGVASHANGDEAVAQVLDAYDRVKVRAVEGFVPRIEHASFIDADLVRRIADQGVAVAAQPDFLRVPAIASAVLPRRLKFIPLRSLVAAGVTVAGSSDAPVQASFAPLAGIVSAMTRRTSQGTPLHEDEALDADQALALYTRDAARISGCSAWSGTLEPGKRADLVVLSHDPRAPGVDWSALRVERTLLAGETVFSHQ